MSMIRISHRLVSMSARGKNSFFSSLVSTLDEIFSGRATTAMFKTPPSLSNYSRPVFLSSPSIRSFHASAILFDEKSKIEKTVDLLKDKVEGEKGKTPPPIPIEKIVAAITPPTDAVAVKRKSLWQKIVHELKHYYNGFKLLFIETKIAFRLLRQVLNGHTLTRRERKQVSDSLLLFLFGTHRGTFSSLVLLLISFGLFHFPSLSLFHSWNLHYLFS